jgi:hypothetical protein
MEAFYETLVDKTRKNFWAIVLDSHIPNPHKCDGYSSSEFMLTQDGWVCKGCQELISLPEDVQARVKKYSHFASFLKD